VTGIANKDTGDAQGDLFFTLLSATKASECDKPNPPPYAGCFLAGDNIFERYRVQVDGGWGIYQECNPASVPLPAEQQNSGSFACCGGLSCSAKPGPFTPKHKNSSDYCYCDRTNRTVGVTTVAAHFGSGPGAAYMPSYLRDTAKLVGGKWYSTPAAGECTGAGRPGDGSGCTWKVMETITTINQSCVREHVFGAVEKNCPLAFRSCPQPYNRSADCYSAVFFDSFLGNATFGCTPMSRAELLVPWDAAFSGGCPSLVPPPSQS
jgi:hypothetical protein